MDKPGFYFCICPDSVLAQQHVQSLIESCGQQQAVTHVFWADEGLDAVFWDNLTLQSLDVSKKNLLVRGAQALPAETWKKLSSALGVPRSGILPVFFLECAWEKGQPKIPAHIAKLRCYEFARKKNWLWSAPALDVRGVRRFLQEKAAARGLKIEPDALDVLGDILSPDAASLSAAVEQLALLTEDGVIRMAHTRDIAQYAPDLVIFDLIRCIQEGRADKAWQAVLREGDSGEALLFPLLSLMAREARILWQLQAGEKVYVPQHVAAMKKKTAARLGPDGLARLFELLCDADWKVKSGRLQPGQVLDQLIAELLLLFSSSGRQGMHLRGC